MSTVCWFYLLILEMIVSGFWFRERKVWELEMPENNRYKSLLNRKINFKMICDTDSDNEGYQVHLSVFIFIEL